MGEKRGMKALEVWCRRVTQGYPGVSVDNMTTSWRDGLAFCAIIHHFRPDLIDFSRLDKSDVLGNNELAFRIAERHLGIPALLDAEDMAEYPVPDKLSIMTYLSQFYQAFASNGSSPIKRASETPDSSLISNVQSPTPKETVLGARKERCRVCSLPVFIAQRLRVGGFLYHRTCFKCFRCGAQLNPTSCCKMDGDNYCCEACPPKEALAPDPPPAPEGGPPPTHDRPSSFTPPLDAQPPSPNRSLVGIRKMMFESYVKETDDAKLLQTTNKDSPTKPSRRLPCVTPPESLAPDRPVQLEDTHSVGLVETCNVALVDKLDSDSDTKIGDVAPETFNPVMLHADKIVLNEDKISLTEAVNTDIIPEDSSLSSQTDKPLEAVNDDLSGTPFADDYTEPPSNKTDYPSDLNPFGEDLDEDSEKVSTNPFGSSSDEEMTPSKNNMRQKSTNPFGSDSEDDEIMKRPVPLPRSGGMHTPEPMPRNSRLRSSNRSLTSLCSVASSRKKRPAPPPPTSPSQVPSPPSPAPSRASISSTLSRKKKHAPPPPPVANIDTGRTSTPVTNSGSTVLTKVQTFSEFLSANQSSLVITDIDIDTPEEKSKVVRRLDPEIKEDKHIGTNYENVSICDEIQNKLDGIAVMDEAVKNILIKDERNLEDEMKEEFMKKEEFLVNQNETSEGPISYVTANEETPYNDSAESPQLPIHDKDLSSVPVGVAPVQRHEEKMDINPEPLKSHQEIPFVEATPEPVKPLKKHQETPVVDTTPKPLKRLQEISLVDTSPEPLKRLQEIPLVDVTPEPHKRLQEIPLVDASPETIQRHHEISFDASPEPIKPFTKYQETKVSDANAEPLKRPQEITLVGTTLKPLNRYQEISVPVVTPEPITLTKHQEVIGMPVGVNTSGRRLIPVPKEAWDSNSSTLSSDSCLDDLPSPPSEKKNKDSANYMTQSIGETGNTDTKTRKKKGKAPMPLAPRRNVKPMPAEQLRQELHDIEIKQQELERQGIALEEKIRDKFSAEDTVTSYVEELILQLFELVNEKNELFRKQAELMYLRRQHHLEEEQADIEYQIRKLMSQPEVNKTDSDKELEDRLISRLVEVVERRDAIIQCLEMDRLREAEEDKSIHAQLSLFSQAMGDEENREWISKKLKKKKNKLTSLSLLELDKDGDSEKHLKKKKKWFPIHNKNKR